ncbi:methyltransferase [bacterium]|nr:methyltransferase [bacterium]
MTEPFVISLLGEGAESGRPATLVDGKILVHTPRGLNPLDRLLAEAAAEIPAERIMTVLNPDAIVALAMRALRPDASVTFFHIDLFHVTQAARLARRHGFTNLDATCAPNLPRETEAPQLILMHVRRDDEAGLTVEMIRQAHAILAHGGKLMAVINNPHDQWLRRQIERAFGGLTIAARSKHGLVYLAKRGGEAIDTGHEQQFIRHVTAAWGGVELECETCYGVFNSGGLDEGSLALLEVMEEPAGGGAIFNPGCNWGAMGLLAAKKFDARRLLLVDANSRSVQMARRNGEKNLPGRVEVRHEFEGEHFLNDEDWGAFDTVVTNPPYATEMRVTEMFARLAQRALRRGGRMWMVGKNNIKMVELVHEIFGDAQTHNRRGYLIASATKK